MTDNRRHNLHQVIDAELMSPVDERVAVSARILSERLGTSVVAVLFYGSCLRTGDFTDKIVDFYVLVDDYRKMWPERRALALANRLLPPNVFYAEVPVDGGEVLRIKYAVLSLAHFERLTSARTLNSSVWARFAQPARLPWCRDDATRGRVTDAVANAVLTTIGAVLPLMMKTFYPLDLWTKAFSETYRVELRSEKTGKGGEIVGLYHDRYVSISPVALAVLDSHIADGGRYTQPDDTMSFKASKWRWRLRRLQGKTLSVLRLIKASFTFDGGIDYLAWKISRHSGVPITVTPWQRRHPVLAGLAMFWRLRRKGAFR